ncbi:hypothetical protein scyTo_0017394, partial [Scyliorhinus torazame]|nr:hypothetical protein [Scyliorhinus torazame]
VGAGKFSNLGIAGAQMEGDNRLPYPICKMDYIVNFCRRHILSGSEANNFTKADLSKPDSVQRLYMRCLQIIFDARPDCLYMMPMSENTPYPQLSEGFIPIMNLNVCMQNLILLCSIPYFEMSDLLNPRSSKKLNLEMMQQMVSSSEEMKYKIESLTTIPPEQKAKIDLLSADISELQQVLNHEYRLKQNLYSKLLAHLEQYHERLAIVTQKATYEGHKQMAEIERAINERI